MIVIPSIQGWEIIFQRAHGLLASKIGFYWQEKVRPKRWIETLTAIAEHDDEQIGWKGMYHITEAGAPKDFSLSKFSLEQAQRIADVSRYKSQWIALMISMHLSYLYESLREEEKAKEAGLNPKEHKKTIEFLDTQKENQKLFRKNLHINQSEAQKAYHLIHFCDRCSLILCRQNIPEDTRQVEVFVLPNGEKGYLHQREDKSICITPWIFEQNEFEVNVEVHCISQLKFENDKELANALPSATIIERKWIFRK